MGVVKTVLEYDRQYTVYSLYAIELLVTGGKRCMYF